MVDPDPVRQNSDQNWNTAPPTIAMIMIPDPSPVRGSQLRDPRGKNAREHDGVKKFHQTEGKKVGPHQ
jgi:hypothetical protein